MKNSELEATISVLYDTSGNPGLCDLYVAEDANRLLERLLKSTLKNPTSSLKECAYIRDAIVSGNADVGVNGLIFRRFEGDFVIYIAEGEPEEFRIKTATLLSAINFLIDWTTNAAERFNTQNNFDGFPYSISTEISGKYKYIVLSKAILEDVIEYSVIDKDSKTNEQKKISREALFGPNSCYAN